MFEVSRQTRERLALAAMPGLVHFGLAPLRLFPMRTCKKLRLQLLGTGILNLESLSLVGPEDVTPFVQEARMSSRHASSNDPERLLSGSPIHTASELCPWWEVTFSKPVQIDEITVGNRLGVWCGRAYGLIVELLDKDGIAWTYDNLSAARFNDQIARFKQQIEAFVSHCYRLPVASRNGSSRALLEFISTATTLTTRVEQALHGANSSERDLIDARIATLAGLDAIHLPLATKDLVSTLKHSYMLFDWLLPRPKAANIDMNLPVELSAMSWMFASILTEQHTVKLAHIKDHDRLLADTACTRFVEETVNTAYKATGLTRTALPIMFRAHGMSGSALLSDPQSFVRSMKEIEEILDGIGYQAAICYGTFLGAVREKGFIPHDDDVDMAFPLKSHGDEGVEEELQAIVATLQKQGVDAGITSGYQFLKIRAPKNKRLVDAFPIIRRGPERVGMYMQELKIRDVPAHVVLPFSSVELYGEIFAAPASVDGFLSERYGSTWQTPLRIIGSKTLEV